MSIIIIIHVWQSQVENEHYSTLSGLVRLAIFLECFIGIDITPDFLCPFDDCIVNFRATTIGIL